MADDEMTEIQISNVRHALGLDSSKVSYRNRYYCSPGTVSNNLWRDLVEKQIAKGTIMGKMDCFSVTRNGAQMVLRKGESLDKEDFPPVKAGKTS